MPCPPSGRPSSDQYVRPRTADVNSVPRDTLRQPADLVRPSTGQSNGRTV
jgi:hypothetical protein